MIHCMADAGHFQELNHVPNHTRTFLSGNIAVFDFFPDRAGNVIEDTMYKRKPVPLDIFGKVILIGFYYGAVDINNIFQGAALPVYKNGFRKASDKEKFPLPLQQFPVC